eukprot:TRINITY_DN2025_c0_g2_i1.p1 TRINITY_DN2025_c0_g2~~TRINITY_DN2025_c0_g2_i1.p1  ORF type:complete len:141 (-),score=19.86 TRINITY_DN2025_c0_g2_i1:71-460(-)
MLRHAPAAIIRAENAARPAFALRKKKRQPMKIGAVAGQARQADDRWAAPVLPAVFSGGKSQPVAGRVFELLPALAFIISLCHGSLPADPWRFDAGKLCARSGLGKRDRNGGAQRRPKRRSPSISSPAFL